MVDLSALSDADLDLIAAGETTGDFTGLSNEGLDALLAGEPLKPTFLARSKEYLGQNGELPGSLGGAIAGAAAGSLVLPVIGTAIGAVVGGAVGAFGGSLFSDHYNQEALDFEDALKEGAISVAFDAVTLGAGKLIKPIAKSLGLNTADLLMNLMGKGTKNNALTPLANLPTNIASGTQESLRLTQEMLEAGGGSLSAVQTGQASFLRATAEELGSIGIISGNIAKKRITANNQVLWDQTQMLINGTDDALTVTGDVLGRQMFGVVEAGRKAAQQLYGDGLDQIVKDFGDRTINLSRIRTAIKLFDTSNVSDVAGDMLSKTSRNLLTDLKLTMGADTARTSNFSGIFDLERKISQNIDDAMPGQAGASASTVRQLSQLRTDLQAAMGKTLELQAKPAGAAYRLLKDTYSNTRSNLLPSITKNVIRKADDDSFRALGAMLIKPTDVGQVKAFMTSIDTAFRDIALVRGSKDFVAPLVKSADEAKAAIRQSWMTQMFSKVGEKSVDFKVLRGLAVRESGNTEEELAKVIMGEQWGQYKRLLNAISDSTSGTNRGLFNLATRSAEIGAAGGAIAGVVGTVSLAAGAGTAGLVFGLPVVLAKVATNKRAVNALIALNGQVKRNPSMAPELLAAGVAKVFNQFNANEREQLSRDLAIRFDTPN